MEHRNLSFQVSSLKVRRCHLRVGIKQVPVDRLKAICDFLPSAEPFGLRDVLPVLGVVIHGLDLSGRN